MTMFANMYGHIYDNYCIIALSRENHAIIYSLFGTAPPHTAFKCKNYYRSHGEICQTFFHQIDFFADSPNFNPSKLSLFMTLAIHFTVKDLLSISNMTEYISYK